MSKRTSKPRVVAKKKKPAAKRKPRARAVAPVEEPVVAEPAPRAFPIEIEPGQIDEVLKKIRTEVTHWTNKGLYTRVRFKFRGKQLLPDIPLAAVVAAEGLSFYWAGLLRALVVNLAGGSLLQVELVNDADKRVHEGREALLGGDVEKALELFRKAAAMDRDNASAQLNIGVALKLRGDVEGARAALEEARRLDPIGSAGQEAERVLSMLAPSLQIRGSN